MATELTDTQIDRAALTPEGRVFALTKSVNFEAAHFIGSKPEGHPYRHVHGHSFVLEVTVSGVVQQGSMWVEDFANVTAALKETAQKLDHRLLNEIEGLEVPTLERLCLWCAQDLKPRLSGLAKVAVCRPSLNERCELTI